MVGADPEVFAVDSEGTIIPAFNFLPEQGKKIRNPYNTAGTLANEAVYNDGFQAEFCFPAMSCHESVVDLTQRGMKFILQLAKKVDPKARLSSSPVLDIPEQLMMKAAEIHTRLGCAPSENIYGDKGTEVVNGAMLPFRFAGFHIHHGIDKANLTPDVVGRAVQALDGIAGVMSIALFGHKEDKRRREFYGRAGEFRLPAHGLEYRVISSRMLQHPVYTHILLDAARWATRIGLTCHYSLLTQTPDDAVRQAINTSDQKLARELLAANKGLILPFLEKRYNSTRGEHVWNLLLGKFKLKSHRTLEDNWKLNNGYTAFAHKEYDPAGWVGGSHGPNCEVGTMQEA
jgi:hypothetical protein